MTHQPERNNWQVHPSRAGDVGSQQFPQTAAPLRVVALFGGQQLCMDARTDPELCAVVDSLNAVSTPYDYLRLVGSVGQVHLNEGSLLTASAQGLLPFHAGLTTALVNVRTLKQLQTIIPLILPEQYLHPKKGGGKSAPEQLNAMEVMDPMREQLKQMAAELRELKELKELEQKAELATVVELERKERENNYKRERDEPRDREDYRGGGESDRKGRRQDDGDNRCHGCGQYGHIRQDCKGPVRRGCVYCRARDHRVEDCETRKNRVCEQCGQKGHSASFHKVRRCRECNNEHSGLSGCG